MLEKFDRPSERILRLLDRQNEEIWRKLGPEYERREITNQNVERLCEKHGGDYRKAPNISQESLDRFATILINLNDPEEVKVLSMRFLDNMTFEMIAKEMDRSRSGVFKIYERAIVSLRNKLSSESLDLTPPRQLRLEDEEATQEDPYS